MNDSGGVGHAGAGCPPHDPVQFVVVPAAYALALCVGLPGNAAALAVLLGRARVREALRIYLVNLTLADILFDLTLPFWIPYYLAGGNWDPPEASCRWAGAAYSLGTYSAMAFAALVSVHRYCTVAGRELATNRPAGARAACAVAWASCLAGAAPSVAARQMHRAAPGGLKCFERHAGPRAYATVALFAASFLVVLGAYLAILRSLAAGSGTGRGGHRRRARALVLGLLLVFAVCVAPYHLSLVPWVASRAAAHACRPPSVLDNVHMLSVALLSLNSCLDPLVYCFSVKRFRADLGSAARTAAHCCCPRPPPPRPPLPPLPEHCGLPTLQSSSLTSS